MRVILLMGPPGVGKGTVAERVAARLGIRHISTGSLLRDAIRQGTPKGRQAEAHITRGELAPDSLIMELVAEQMDRAGGADVLLDGFPRTRAQADLLDRALAEREGRVKAAIDGWGRDWLDPDATMQVVRDYIRRGGDNSFPLWQLINLGLAVEVAAKGRS